MSIPKKRSKRANSESLKRKYPQGYVVAESVINNFIGSLYPCDIDAAASRLQTVVDLTGRMLDERIERISESDHNLLKELTEESNNKHYRRLMKAILAGIKEGPRGVNAAYLTAFQIVKMAFYWTPDYVEALEAYKSKLRRVRQASKTG